MKKNSEILQNRLSPWTALTMISLYVAALAYFYFSIEELFWYDDRRVMTWFSALIIWIILAWLISSIILNNCKKSRLDETQHFYRFLPLAPFGSSIGSFQHVFMSDKNLEEALVREIKNEVDTLNIGATFLSLNLKDKDKNLSKRDDRSFTIIRFPKTDRSTEISIALKTEMLSQLQSIRWWILKKGPISKTSQFLFIAFSPITLPIMVVRHLRGRADFISKMEEPYSSAYDKMDVDTYWRWAHESVFVALLNELEKNDVDTSDLRQQKAQVMNISISGGKADFGNIIQGAFNTVRSARKQG